MSYTGQLAVHPKAQRLVALRDDCVELSGRDCGDCPMIGQCAIHIRMTREMNRAFPQEYKMTFVRSVAGSNWSATALRKEASGLVIYQATKSTSGERHRVSVPADIAADSGRLQSYLEQQVSQGTDGAKILCG